MALQSVDYKCPACGGPFAFDATLGKLKCEYCDSVFTPEEVDAYYAEKQQKAEDKADKIKEEEQAKAEAEQAANRVEDANESSSYTAQSDDPIQAYLDSKKNLSDDDGSTSAVTCSSCGATLIVSDTAAVSQCPYCGNNSIVPGKVGNTLEPDLIIPFSTTKESAVSALKNHYAGKICLPKAFKNENHIEEVQGIYVPFWLYSGVAEGDASFTATDTRVWSDGDYNYTETSTFDCTRSGYCKFDKVPADGSKRMPNDHMDSIEPYDYSAFKPFSTAYLPGFAADRYDESVKECSARVKGRMKASVEEELQSTVTNHQTVSMTSSTVEEKITDVKYALLPVWMLHTRWNNQDFLFAMNGQTGRLIGDLPLDKGKLNLISAATFIGVFAVTFIAAYLGLN